MRAALADAAAGRRSYWDGLLLATAREAGCVAILTEGVTFLVDGADSWAASESIIRLLQEEGSPGRRAGCWAYNSNRALLITECQSP